jgi:hypothetical protein
LLGPHLLPENALLFASWKFRELARRIVALAFALSSRAKLFSGIGV